MKYQSKEFCTNERFEFSERLHDIVILFSEHTSSSTFVAIEIELRTIIFIKIYYMFIDVLVL